MYKKFLIRVETTRFRGKRPLRRPKRRWADNVSSDIYGLGVSDEWMRMRNGGGHGKTWRFGECGHTLTSLV